MQSFTALMPLLTATSAFGLRRRQTPEISTVLSALSLYPVPVDTNRVAYSLRYALIQRFKT